MSNKSEILTAYISINRSRSTVIIVNMYTGFIGIKAMSYLAASFPSLLNRFSIPIMAGAAAFNPGTWCTAHREYYSSDFCVLFITLCVCV